MRIWIDIINSPQVLFFRPFIKYWEQNGYTVAITARDYSNTIELLEAENQKFSIVGSHAGKSTILKLLNFPLRIYHLVLWLRRNKPTVGISQSSFYSPLAGWLCGVKTIYTNDNEYAKGNIISFVFASCVMLPEPMRISIKKNVFYSFSKVQFYTGIKEGLYLKDFGLMKTRDVKDQKITIYFRPDPWEAQYYTPNFTVVNSVIKTLIQFAKVVVLPRSVKQRQYFETSFCEEIEVVKGVVTLDEILRKADIFVGAGGSMSRELAFMGVPTISIYQGELLAVDRYLSDLGVLHHRRTINYEEIKAIQRLQPSNSVYEELAHKGELAFEEFNKALIKIDKKGF